ncbi:carboxypeptidase regulatory-like domain-containing protein [Halobellus sp. GM3]|uniref:carboxypeptidase regulatory-like domain-containing protein n=1 Tax=Halobellus sp. GM3 TaxID=3458410 RepID=UPI00403DDAFE
MHLADREHIILVFVVIALLAVGVLSGGAAAASPGGIAVDNPADSAEADHEWNATLPSGANGTLEHLIVNYTGTGADLTDPGIYVQGVTANQSTVTVKSMSFESGTKANLTLGSPVVVSEGDRVNFTAINVRNPSTATTHTASIELNNSTETFGSKSESFTIEAGGDINGTVTNSSTEMSGVSVMAFNATTDEYITSTQTDASGNYSFRFVPDKYRIEPSATAYAVDAVNVTVSQGSTSVQDFTLTKKGYLNGTVTDQGGNGVGGINLIADERGTSDGRGTTTAPDGSFSFRLKPGQYDLVAYDNDDYEFELTANLTVSSDQETVSGLTVTEKPASGTVTGRVVTADGTPITGERVSAGDSSYRYYNSTMTNGSGYFTLRVPEGVYRVSTNPSGRPAERETGVSVTAGEPTDVELVVPERAYVTGRVTNSSGGVPNVPILADSDDGQYFNMTNATGHYNITVAPGEYTTSVFASGQDAESKTVDATTGSVSTADFTLVKTEVVAKSVAIESGPGSEAELGVRAQVSSGLLQIQLVNESQTPGSSVGAPQELESMGVSDDTEFNITVTVTNFSADSLLWGLDDAHYSTTENETVTNGTDVTITGKPVTLQATRSSGTSVGPLLFKDPGDVQWPTERKDRADEGFNKTVYIGIFDLANVPGEVRETLRGVSVTTNAQRFSTPAVKDESLRIWIAGPSTTVDGEEHTGFYQATIPDALLDEWGVDDPETELQALYKGSSRDFTVTETAGGARIRLENINYSAGYVEVQANPQSDGPSSSGSDSDSSDDTPTPTATPAPTDSPTPTVVETATPTAASGDDAGSDSPTPTDSRVTDRKTTAFGGQTSQPMPGMGVGAAVLALLGSGLLVGRRR